MYMYWHKYHYRTVPPISRESFIVIISTAYNLSLTLNINLYHSKEHVNIIILK